MNNQGSNSENTIVINATNIGSRFNGLGVYSLNILKKFTQLKTHINFIVYLNESCSQHTNGIEFPENFKINWVSSIISPDRNFRGHILRLIYSNYLSFKHRRYLIFNTSQLEINFFRKNQVVTIHDVIPLLFKKYHKKQFPYFKLILKYGLKYANYVLTPSHHSKDLLQKIYGLSDRRIRYIHNGVTTEPDIIDSNSQLKNEKYILYLGRISKMKNIANILKSFSEIQKKHNHKLVIVGNDAHKFEREMRCARISDQVMEKIIYVHDINEDTKNELMKNSSLFIYPSLYEGFGLPPLEAMANGCPVIVSNNSSLPEVCGDAAVYVDPHNIIEISSAIDKVLSDNTLRKNLIEKGLERSRQFSWNESAEEHLHVFEHVLQHSHFPEKVRRIEFVPAVITSINLDIREARG